MHSIERRNICVIVFDPNTQRTSFGAYQMCARVFGINLGIFKQLEPRGTALERGNDLQSRRLYDQ